MSELDTPESHGDADRQGRAHADLALAFRDGARVVERDGRALAIRVVHAGDLDVPTGRIIACDPFWLANAPPPYTAVVPAGRHGVFLSIADYGDDRRVACALLRCGAGDAVRWEMAVVPGQDPATLEPGQLFAYGVDAGTGCFVDEAVAESWLAQTGMGSMAAWRRGADPSSGPTPERTALVDAVYDWLDAFGDRLSALLARADQRAACGWASVAEEGYTGNLIAFSSGWGDGRYGSFFGYDAAGRISCLVTDFQVLPAAQG